MTSEPILNNEATRLSHYRDRAMQFAGNWRDFESFAWRDAPNDADQWGILYTHHRDGGLLDQSNAETMARELEPFGEAYVVAEHHGHWAVGWVEGFSVRVYEADGTTLTPAFVRLCELQDAMADYPSLDDDRYSELQFEAAHDAIEQEGQWYVSDAPDTWVGDVYSWLSEHMPDELEDDGQDQGAYPSTESVWAALDALGYLEPDDDDDREAQP